MGDSIAAAVQATCNSQGGWMVLPADLPLIRTKTLLQIAQAPMTGQVLVPCFDGRRGHPVRFAPDCRNALLALKGDQGAARVLTAYTAIKLEVDDAGCVTDIDTLDDLIRARLAASR